MSVKKKNEVDLEIAFDPFKQILTEILGLPGMLQELNQEMAEYGERFSEIKSTQRTHRSGLQELVEVFREQTDALKAFYQKQQCLEEASRQQTLLTQEHFNRHIVEPLARRIFPIIDMAEESSKGQSDSQLSDAFEAFRMELLDLLAGYGVELVSVVQGELFNAKTMQPACFANTEKESMNMTVNAIVRSGFRHEDRILRPATVELYRFNSPRNISQTCEKGNEHE